MRKPSMPMVWSRPRITLRLSVPCDLISVAWMTLALQRSATLRWNTSKTRFPLAETRTASLSCTCTDEVLLVVIGRFLPNCQHSGQVRQNLVSFLSHQYSLTKRRAASADIPQRRGDMKHHARLQHRRVVALDEDRAIISVGWKGESL